MQLPEEIVVSWFQWDDANLTHCARHGVTPVIVAEVRDNTPLFFLNDPSKSGTHIMIGPDDSGRLWTIVIVNSGGSDSWRPITGWPSDNAEIRKYNEHHH